MRAKSSKQRCPALCFIKQNAVYVTSISRTILSLEPSGGLGKEELLCKQMEIPIHYVSRYCTC